MDVGCGNGKYLTVNPNVFIVASDRSTKLSTIASTHQPHAAVVADNLELPHPRGKFDFAISVAVVHHLSTPERRIGAVRAVLETLRPGSGGQDAGGKALIYVWALEQKHSRRGWDEGDEQDVMVPWVMRFDGNSSSKKATEKKNRDRSGAAAAKHGGSQAMAEDSDGSKTFHRYYHLYRRGELEHDISEAGGVVVESGYEKDNWWALAALK